MGTTYFGRSFGVMALFDSISKQALSVEVVKYETNARYQGAMSFAGKRHSDTERYL